jgi:chromosome segregation ATPase
MVILNDDGNIAWEIAGASRIGSHNTPFAQKTMRHLPAQGRAASSWITAAILAMALGSETLASPDQARQGLADAQHAKVARNVDVDGTAGDGHFEAGPGSRGSSDKSVQVAQATTSDTGAPQQSLKQEQHSADTLGCELTTARRDVDFLQYLDQEHDRAERLEQDLAAARRELEIQTGLVAKASDEASRVEQAERRAAELQKSHQHERERAARLEQDLATARRDLEAQAALAAKANAETTRLNQFSASSLDLEGLLQERERAEVVAQELLTARAKLYAYEARDARASDQEAQHRQAESNTVEQQKSSQEERDRAERLEHDLETARGDIETQSAPAANARDEAVQVRQAAEHDSAELRSSLQQERARAERLESDLAFAQRKNDAPSAKDSTASSKAVTVGQIAGDKPVDAEAIAARLVARGSALVGHGDIGAARLVLERAADMGSAQASFALAETYDPFILRKWGTYGTLADASRARDLYAKAEAGGIKQAKAPFEALRSFAPAP